MATIKSFTDLSQSKMLAKILPLESADMRIGNYVGKSGKVDGTNVHYYSKGESFGAPEIINAWSLAALLGVLPKGEYKDADLCFGGYQGDKYISEWFCSYEQQEPFIIKVCHADNPVDACCEMILKLHELKML